MYWNRITAWPFTTRLWLTLTWDVLKLKIRGRCNVWSCWLTLTWDVLKYGEPVTEAGLCNGLTLTWDVLKSFSSCKKCWWGIRLTLTWDVLKWQLLRIMVMSLAD